MREPQLKLDRLQSGKGSGCFAAAKHNLLFNRNMIINVKTPAVKPCIVHIIVLLCSVGSKVPGA
jgi:hypothetical protein